MIIKISLKGKNRELYGDALQPGERWNLMLMKDRRELDIFTGQTLSDWESTQRYFERNNSNQELASIINDEPALKKDWETKSIKEQKPCQTLK